MKIIAHCALCSLALLAAGCGKQKAEGTKALPPVEHGAAHGNTYIRSQVLHSLFRQPTRPFTDTQVNIKGWSSGNRAPVFEYWAQTDTNGFFQVRVSPGVYPKIMIEAKNRSILYTNIVLTADQAVELPPLIWRSGR